MNSASHLAVLLLLCSFILNPVSGAYRPFKRAENTVIPSRVFSEEIENGYSGRMSGPVAGLRCFGDYCDDKQLLSVQRNGQTAVAFTNYFTPFFSDIGRTSAFCPSDSVVVEIQCRGDYCYSMRLHCARMANGYRVDRGDTRFVDFFSEEQGKRLCPDGYYVYGMYCRGDFCDDVALACARVDFDSSITDN